MKLNSQKALNEYFLTISEMVNIIDNFCEVFIIQSQAPKRTHHYKIVASKIQRINNSVKKVQECFFSRDILFEKSDVVFNVLTKKLLPGNLAKELSEIKKEWCKFYEKVIKEQMVAPKSTWNYIISFQCLQITRRLLLQKSEIDYKYKSIYKT